jgi:hypothetical protein
MARKYSRDKNGRFASSSAGGATARGARIGGKGKGPAVRTAGVSAPKGTIAKSSFNRSIAGVMGMSGSTTAKRASASMPTAKSAKPSMKSAKTSKAPMNKAKEAYKAAKSQVRELKMYRGGKTDQVVKNAQAKVKRLEKSRGTSKSRSKKA